MSRKLKLIGWVVLLMMVFWKTADAEQGGVAVSVKASTLGVGGALTVGVAPKLNARISVDGFTYKYDTTQGGIPLSFDLGLFSARALADLHPTGGGFRLSGGLMLNKNKIDSKSRPANSYTVGNQTYAAADVGTLTGKMEFNTIAPYVGLGFGNAVGEDKKIGVVFDLGLAFQGSPKVDLRALGGLLASDANFLADLEREERELEDDINSFKYYPVISIGLSYRFR